MGDPGEVYHPSCGIFLHFTILNLTSRQWRKIRSGNQPGSLWIKFVEGTWGLGLLALAFTIAGTQRERRSVSTPGLPSMWLREWGHHRCKRDGSGRKRVYLWAGQFKSPVLEEGNSRRIWDYIYSLPCIIGFLAQYPAKIWGLRHIW